MKKLITPKELAEAMGYSLSGIYSMIARGELRRVPGIRSVRFEPDYLNRKFGLDFGKEKKEPAENAVPFERYEALRRENAELRSRLEQIRMMADA